VYFTAIFHTCVKYRRGVRFLLQLHSDWDPKVATFTKGAREDEGKAAAQAPHLDRDDAKVGRGAICRLFEDTGRKAREPQQSDALTNYSEQFTVSHIVISHNTAGCR